MSLDRSNEIASGEFRFIEPFLEKTCIMCAAKGKWQRHKKLLRCTSCFAEYMPMPDGSLAVMSRAPQPASPAAA